MKKVIPFVIGILMAGILQVRAQNTDLESVPAYKHYIGAGAGLTTGYGLSYRYMPTKLGSQINFAPYHTSETDRYSLGLSFFYMLVKSKLTNLMLYQGNHFYYSSELYYYTDAGHMIQTTDPTDFRKRSIENFFNNGLGICIELIIAKRIALDLMVGYAFYDNFRQINFTGESGLYFRF